MKIDLKEELECTVCLDLAMSPIQSCRNGHILCGLCFDTLKKCSVCKEDLSSCYFAERLVKKFDVKAECKYDESGCKDLIRLDQMRAHIPFCEYRLIKCFYCNEKFGLKKFGQHLKDQHKTPQRTLTSWRSGVLVFHCYFDQHKINNGGYEGCYFNAKYFNYEGQEFLFHTHFQQDTLFWWITILEGVYEASKFTFKTSILQKNPQKLASDILNSCSWEFPVLPIHGHSDFKGALKTGAFASIHWKALERQYSVIAHETKYSFDIQVQEVQRVTHNETAFSTLKLYTNSVNSLSNIFCSFMNFLKLKNRLQSAKQKLLNYFN